MSGGWEIRDGDRSDLPELERLWRDLYAHHREVATGAIQFRPADERWPARLREFERSVDEDAAVFLIAESSGEPVGFAFSTVRPADPVFATGPVGELDVLVVAPGRRSEGIGEELARRSLSGLRDMGARTLRVVVVAGNETALRFYSRLGIEPALIELLAPLDDDPEGPGEST